MPTRCAAWGGASLGIGTLAYALFSPSNAGCSTNLVVLTHATVTARGCAASSLVAHIGVGLMLLGAVLLLGSFILLVRNRRQVSDEGASGTGSAVAAPPATATVEAGTAPATAAPVTPAPSAPAPTSPAPSAPAPSAPAPTSPAAAPARVPAAPVAQGAADEVVGRGRPEGPSRRGESEREGPIPPEPIPPGSITREGVTRESATWEAVTREARTGDADPAQNGHPAWHEPLTEVPVALPPGWYGNPDTPGKPVQWWDGTRLTDRPPRPGR